MDHRLASVESAERLTRTLRDPRSVLWGVLRAILLLAGAVLATVAATLETDVPLALAVVAVPAAAFVAGAFAARSPAGSRFIPALHVAGAVALSAVPLLVPELCELSLVVLVAALAVVAATTSARLADFTMVATWLVVAGSIVAHTPPAGWRHLAVFAIGCFAVRSLARRLARTTAGMRRDIDALFDSLGVSFWMADGESDDPHTVIGNAGASTGRDVNYYLQAGAWAAELHPADRAVIEYSDHEARALHTHEIRYRARHADGSYRWHEEIVAPVTDAGGRLVGTRGVRRDISATIDAELAAEQFSRFVESLPLGVMLIDIADGHVRVTAVNASLDRFTRHGRERLVGHRLSAVIRDSTSPQAAEELVDFVTRCLASGEQGTKRVSLSAAKHRGEVLDVDVIPMSATGGALVLEDVTAQVQAEAELSRQAHTDELTGLMNRAALIERLDAAIAERGERPVTLALIDLDHFKHVNDSFGHQRGDELLVAVTRALAAVLNEGITFARLGGDEFALLLPVGSTTADAVAVAHRVSAALDPGVVLSGGLPFHVGASVGVATLPDHAASIGELLAKADVAMYLAKARGGGYAIYDSALDTSSTRRVLLLGDLHRALSHGEIVCHFQPVADRHGQIVGCEALARWQHPDLGLLAPDEFIELAELTSLSDPLAIVMLRHSLALLELLDSLGHRLGVSVNLTINNLTNPTFLTDVEQLLTSSGVDASLVTVEITERLSGDGNVEALVAGMTRLQRLGVSVALDDFGVGSTSLSFLSRLVFQQIKIDRALVHGSGDSAPITDTITRGLVRTSHDLGLIVIAEGVEDEATRQRMLDAGCDHIQGFIIAPSMTAADLIGDLQSGRLPTVSSRRVGRRRTQG